MGRDGGARRRGRGRDGMHRTPRVDVTASRAEAEAHRSGSADEAFRAKTRPDRLLRPAASAHAAENVKHGFRDPEISLHSRLLLCFPSSVGNLGLWIEWLRLR